MEEILKEIEALKLRIKAEEIRTRFLMNQNREFKALLQEVYDAKVGK